MKISMMTNLLNRDDINLEEVKTVLINYQLPNLCSRITLEEAKVYKCETILRGKFNLGYANYVFYIVIEMNEALRRQSLNKFELNFDYYFHLGKLAII